MSFRRKITIYSGTIVGMWCIFALAFWGFWHAGIILGETGILKIEFLIPAILVVIGMLVGLGFGVYNLARKS